jgi:uncharacterized protein (TIGR03905 family)
MIYKPKGVCAQAINFEIDGSVIKSVEFIGGCPGNALGVSRLVEGMPVEEAIKRLEGIKCGSRSTSCPDQLAMALRQAMK